MNPKTIGLVCIFLVTVSALPSGNAVGSDNDLMDSIYTDCLRKDSVNCVKYKLVSFVDKVVGAREAFSLTDGVTVVKVPGAEQEGAPRAISGDESVESLIFSRIQSFMNTHTIKVELKGSDIVSAVTSTGRALEDVSENYFGDDDSKDESRGKKKKAAKLLGPLLAMMALKAAALLPLLLGAIALIAGKALLIGKIALVLSAIIGLKKLLSQEKHVTYEVVAHPHHTSSHSTSSHGGDSFAGGFSGGDASSYGASSSSSGGGHGWARAYENAQDLAYKSQKP